MASVALIGGDGAGKTTVARRLAEAGDLKIEYLYLGMSAQSGDHLLPTSRLLLRLRRRAYRRKAEESPGGRSEGVRIPASDYEYSGRKRGSLWVTARLVNRFVEAWYRQIISLFLQARGYTVVYDRHLLFDAGILDPSRSPRRLSERIYRRIMRSLYPRPDAVILLDASGEVLHSRKGEASPEYLDRETEMYLAQATHVRRFVRLDATRPLAEVVEEAKAIVAELDSDRHRRAHPGVRGL